MKIHKIIKNIVNIRFDFRASKNRSCLIRTDKGDVIERVAAAGMASNEPSVSRDNEAVRCCLPFEIKHFLQGRRFTAYRKTQMTPVVRKIGCQHVLISPRIQCFGPIIPPLVLYLKMMDLP